MKSEANLENLFSGEANYDTSGVMYGPYDQPFAAPMNDFVGFEPLYSEHINSSGICASCHTLLTSSVDLEGNPTGRKFVEQATYHEWINSAYDDDGSSPQSCQNCHMRRLEDKVVISANYIFLQPRSPYALHDLVGANSTMVELMMENKEALDIDIEDQHFQETIEKTIEMLQRKSVDTELTEVGQTKDSIFFDFEITNRAGHKFPSGYPSRRVFIEFVLSTEEGDTLFSSGTIDEEYEVKGQSPEVEPHHNVISNEDQVQIYELALGDVNGSFTTLLERSDVALKDNRLPPLGFRKDHIVYDTTKIYGQALTDEDFNTDGDQEGTGADVVHFRIAKNDIEGHAIVTSKVYYQSMPPRWMNPMLSESSEAIDIFRDMYNSADLNPVLVSADTLSDIVLGSNSISKITIDELSVYPNPTRDGHVQISTELSINRCDILSSTGKLMVSTRDQDQIVLPSRTGIYFLKVYTSKGIVTRKVLRQ